MTAITMKRYILGTVLVGALALPVSVRAEDAGAAAAANDAPVAAPDRPGRDRPNPGDRMFDMLDADKSGDVSLKEFLAKHETRFKDMDKDGDGKLTREEIKAEREGRKDKLDDMREKRMDKKEDVAPAEDKPAEKPAE